LNEKHPDMTVDCKRNNRQKLFQSKMQNGQKLMNIFSGKKKERVLFHRRKRMKGRKERKEEF